MTPPDHLSAPTDKPAPGPVASLRRELESLGLDGFIVPRSDEFLGEYVPPSAERLAWLTGFTGSAGTAIILADKAALFVDGRYTLQAAKEIDTSSFAVVPIAETPPDAWLADALSPGQAVGYDPRLHSRAQAKRLGEALAAARVELVPLDENPIDRLWQDRPRPPRAPALVHDQRYAGESSEAKRTRLGKAIAEKDCDAAIVNSPDSVAWLLNIRGGDLDYSPIALSHAILNRNGEATLFIDPAKRTDALEAHLGNRVAIAPIESFAAALKSLGDSGIRVGADPAAASDWVFRLLEDSGADVVAITDPCALPKAIKNAVELDGMRAAHRRDGAALTRFLHWLAVHAPAGGVTELSASDRLEAFRRADESCRGLSFPTIAGAGPNGAIVHYRVTPATSRSLTPNSLFLVDSGGQYPDGTTDVTRTVAIGVPNTEMRDRFTRVLKGHIALATALFPEGTTGSQLDSWARAALWRAGLDYDHGTGHGVGSFLNVHEGPHRISKTGGGPALQPGMIVSNEPGFYRTDAYGIRIENLVAVESRPTPPGGDRKMLGFETLTRAPIDRTLIARDLLTEDERAWVDAYHAGVLADLAPLLDATAGAWLAEVARPL